MQRPWGFQNPLQYCFVRFNIRRNNCSLKHVHNLINNSSMFIVSFIVLTKKKMLLKSSSVNSY